MGQHLFDFYKLPSLSQTKNRNVQFLLLSSEMDFLNQCYGVSPTSVFCALSVILTLLDGWVIEKHMLSIKARNKQTTSFFIKTLAQTLASTKKQRCIQSLVKHLRRGSSGDLAVLPNLWVKVIWFLSLLIKQRFSPEILRTQ